MNYTRVIRKKYPMNSTILEDTQRSPPKENCAKTTITTRLAVALVGVALFSRIELRDGTKVLRQSDILLERKKVENSELVKQVDTEMADALALQKEVADLKQPSAQVQTQLGQATTMRADTLKQSKAAGVALQAQLEEAKAPAKKLQIQVNESKVAIEAVQKRLSEVSARGSFASSKNCFLNHAICRVGGGTRKDGGGGSRHAKPKTENGIGAFAA